jgi:hypothetical protein
MSPSAERNTLRFAVGSPSEPVSALWRLHVARDDVYIATNHGSANVPVLKISLHQSGIWVAAFPEHSRIVAPDSGNRRVARWERPDEFVRGWTLAAHIDVPSVARDVGLPRRNLDVRGRPVTWIAPAGLHGGVLVSVYMARPGYAADDWMRTVAGIPNGDELAALRKFNGETVYVMADRRPMGDEYESALNELMSDRRYRMAASSEFDADLGGSLFVVKDDAPIPSIMDVALPIDFRAEHPVSADPVRHFVGVTRYEK